MSDIGSTLGAGVRAPLYLFLQYFSMAFDRAPGWRKRSCRSVIMEDRLENWRTLGAAVRFLGKRRLLVSVLALVGTLGATQPAYAALPVCGAGTLTFSAVGANATTNPSPLSFYNNNVTYEGAAPGTSFCDQGFGLFTAPGEDINSNNTFGDTNNTPAQNTLDTGKAKYLFTWDASGGPNYDTYTVKLLSLDTGTTGGTDTITLYVCDINCSGPTNASVVLSVTLPGVAGPAVTSLSNTSGTVAGGTSVTITGTGFSSVTAVKFGTTAAAGFTVVSTTSITATAPAGTVGTVDVTVTANGGTSAVTAADHFTYSASVSGAPTIGTATASSGQATVSFSAPGSNGGAVITGYTVTSTPGNISATGTASPITVTGLTNGTSYTFKVVANNSVGSSAASAASNSVTPATVPGAPTIGTATASNAQATVAFVAPGSTGGASITGYTVTSTPGNIFATGTASPIMVTGLTNGTSYTFKVTATNSVGTGAASAASNSVTPSPLIAVSTSSLTGGTVAVAYSETVSASGGTSPYAYTVSLGSLPGGLSLSATGVLSGTPTGGGSFPVTIRATDHNNFTGTAAYTLVIAQGTPVISWSPGATFAYTGIPLGASVLNATSTAPGTFAYTATPSGGSPTAVTTSSVLAAGNYTLTANFTPATPVDYTTGNATSPFSVVVQHVWVVNNNGTVSSLDDGGGVLNGSASNGGKFGVAIDNAGNIWSANSNGSTLSEFDKSGAVISSTIGGGGLNSAAALAIDGTGYVWVANGNNSVSVFSNAGVVVSPDGGYTGGLLSSPSGVAIDISGSVWISNSGNDSVTRILGGAAPAAPIVTGVINSTLGARP